MAVYGGRKSGFRNQPRQFAALVKFKTSGAQSSPGGTVCAKAYGELCHASPRMTSENADGDVCFGFVASKIEDAVSLLSSVRWTKQAVPFRVLYRMEPHLPESSRRGDLTAVRMPLRQSGSRDCRENVSAAAVPAVSHRRLPVQNPSLLRLRRKESGQKKPARQARARGCHSLLQRSHPAERKQIYCPHSPESRGSFHK